MKNYSPEYASDRQLLKSRKSALAYSFRWLLAHPIFQLRLTTTITTLIFVTACAIPEQLPNRVETPPINVQNLWKISNDSEVNALFQGIKDIFDSQDLSDAQRVFNSLGILQDHPNVALNLDAPPPQMVYALRSKFLTNSSFGIRKRLRDSDSQVIELSFYVTKIPTCVSESDANRLFGQGKPLHSQVPPLHWKSEDGPLPFGTLYEVKKPGGIRLSLSFHGSGCLGSMDMAQIISKTKTK